MKVNNEFNLSGSEGSSDKAQNYFIIIHETANATATGRNEATYMKRNWNSAYTTDIIGDKGVDYRIGEWGYVSWGALNANGYAPVQIELQHSLDKATFQENYKAYIELIRKACDTFGIPKTLDTAGKYTKGVKSHDWISKNWGGDHTDPYSYLSQMGVSKAQLAKDIANGISGATATQRSEDIGVPQPKLGLWYRGHIADEGWAWYVGTDGTAGTVGKNRALEAVEVLWNGSPNYIRSSYHKLGGGWTEVPKGITGTTGKAQKLDQMCFTTNDNLKKTGRKIQYRVHSQDVGWGAWTNEGQIAGKLGKKIEAIQMRIMLNGKVEKG